MLVPMRVRSARAFLLSSLTLSVACVTACGSSDGVPSGGVPSGDAGTTPSVRSLPCDVDAVLEKRCRSCHSDPPQFGAPMPLVTYDQLHDDAVIASSEVFEEVAARVTDAADPMPPAPSAPLDAAEQKTLTDWVSAGAPARTGAACTGTPKPTVNPLGCTTDLLIAPSEPYTMPAERDDEYVCWGVDLTRPDPTHIVGFAPQIDNTEIVHHVVVYEAPTSVSSKPTSCSAGGSLFWRMVFAWAPGVSGFELPPEAGFPIATTGATHYVVQMHYSNPKRAAGKKDESKVGFCTSPPRPNEADVLAFGTQKINIPARPPVGGTYRTRCSVTVPSFLSGKRFFTAMPHMHKLGTEMTTLLARAAGGTADLGTVPRFDFFTQSWLPVDATSAEGDVITTTCGWVNPTGTPVGFGENTADEMCYSFTMYYPRIKQAGWSWAAPALLARCD